MGSFANALFSVLLGWLRGAAAWLWQLVTGAETAAWIRWVLENWLPLTVLLCVAGIVVDLAVCFFRWQPYRVWKRFLHRNQDDEAEDRNGLEVLPQKRWIYADGSSMPVREAPASLDGQERFSPAAQRARWDAPELDAPLRPVKRVQPAKLRRHAGGSGEYQLPGLTGEQDTYHQPYYPPQWTETQENTEEPHDESATGIH